MPRLLTMLLMVAILGLIFVRFREASTWRLFASADEGGQVVPETTAAHSASTGASPKEKPPEGGTANAATPELTTKGTDLDPQEMEDIKPSLSVLYDGSIQTMPAEQPAYFQILGWVDHQSTEELRKRAMKDFFYNTLINSPETMRLQIVEVKLTVLQIVRVMGVPKDGRPQPLLSPEGKQLYEVRGVSRESGSNLYFAMVTDVPADMPLGTFVNQDARLVGYFFKVQGYISQQQQLDAELSRRKMKPLKAPLIIGRMIWSKQPTAVAADNTPVWVLAPIGGVAIIMVVGWVLWSSRRTRQVALPQAARLSRIDPDAPSVDNWLDEAQSGRMEMEMVPEASAHSDGASVDLGFGGRFAGNIFQDRGESNNRERPSNGHASNKGGDGPEPEVRENDGPDRIT
jgi:hypothetical protein